MLKTDTNRVNFNLVETSGNTAVSMEQYIQDRTQLTELTIPETTPYIGTYAFINCIGLTKVVVPNSVDVIEENAFTNCSNIENIHVHKSKYTVSGYPWGATNATVTWDAAYINWNIINAEDCVMIMEDEIITDNPYMTKYVGDISWKVYSKDFPVNSGVFNAPEILGEYNLDIELVDNGSVRLDIVPDVADCEITLSYDVLTTVSDYIIVAPGTEVFYTIKCDGYKTKKSKVIVNEDTILDIVMDAYIIQPNTVLATYTSGGTYTVDVADDGEFQLYIVAGGGGGAYKARSSSYRVCAGGGSGSGWGGTIPLTKGTYTLVVGSGGSYSGTTSTTSNQGYTGSSGGNSTFTDANGNVLVTTYGGKGGYAYRGSSSSSYSGTAGAGGSAPLLTITPMSVLLNKSGNSGGLTYSSSGTNGASGGSAVYSSYGKGGNSNTSGTAGYIQLTYIDALPE